MHLSEMEQVQGALKPLRKVLDELDKAVEMQRQLHTDHSSYTTEIPKLKEEIDLLVAEKKKLSLECDEIHKAQALARLEGQTKVTGLKRHANDLQNQINIMIADRDSLKGEIEKIKKANEVIARAELKQEEIKKAQGEIKSLMDELGALKNQKEIEEGEIAKAREEFRKWKESLKL